MEDIQSEQDLEMGKSDSTDEQNLSKFFEEVKAIKIDMEEITNLLIDLQDLNEESRSTHSAKILKGIRDRINSDMAYKEGSPVDRSRVSVTNGLRAKLRDMMRDFQALRENILKDHKEGLKRRYYNATGEHPTEEMIEKMISRDEEKGKQLGLLGWGLVADSPGNSRFHLSFLKSFGDHSLV
ncbi:hypothetical protein OIU77_028973 [Salix suchowensis]|uniref:Syntaxin N-terminal domain-containing protein n=1 Tax=Salix suchowensis TaxID=1278906 RepID=A0ABQ9BJA6_9ROSI|nr:hypothetical protein OIU77_028973 [Salix suchowensis]